MDDLSRDLSDDELVAFFNPGDAFGPNWQLLADEDMPEHVKRCIASIERDGNKVTITFHDKLAALQRLAKRHE